MGVALDWLVIYLSVSILFLFHLLNSALSILPPTLIRLILEDLLGPLIPKVSAEILED